MKPVLVSTVAVTLVAFGIIAGATVLRGGDVLAPITRTELERTPEETVYGAIQSLRRGWIDPARDSAGLPAAYIEMRCAETGCLRWVATDQAEEIRFLPAGSAAHPWLRSEIADAIVVTLRPSDTLTAGANR